VGVCSASGELRRRGEEEVLRRLLTPEGVGGLLRFCRALRGTLLRDVTITIFTEVLYRSRYALPSALITQAAFGFGGPGGFV